VSLLGAALMWVLLFWALFRIRRASLRFLETQKRRANVGTKWEQIAPMEECFDFYEYEEDDL